MKKIYLLLGFFLFGTIVSAQSWLTKLPQDKSPKDITLFDYQKAFEDYWAPFNIIDGYYDQNGVKTKASGWKQFYRWFWNMENQVDKAGHFPDKTAQQVYDEYLQSYPVYTRSGTANWTSLGSNSSEGGYAGVGRLNCIEFHPSDYVTSKTIYIATGDRDAWDNRSIGVLKSTNGGFSWDTTGLKFSLSDNAMVSRILIDPNNNQTLIAATTKGVFKTTNGGATWNTRLTLVDFIDLEYKPGDFNVLYGSTRNGGIYRSINGGVKWNQILFVQNGMRTELAVSPDQPAWVYAVVAGTNKALKAVFKSTNSGAGYTKIFDGTTPGNNLLGRASDGYDTVGQGFYDLAITVSPTDANILFIGGINTWGSNDGGIYWQIVNHWWGDGVQEVHADKHMLKYRSNGDLFECNDGGVYISGNNGIDFADITNGMTIGQIYKLGVSQTVSNEIITGLQDNGTKLRSAGIWKDILGGDGMECLIDYTDVNTQYGSLYYGDIHRTTDRWLYTDDNIKPVDAGKGAWITPFIIDLKNNNTLYAGFADVWKTTDQGDNWTQISQINSTEKLRSMAIAPSNNKVLYVADNTNIWKTTDGGANWINITGNLPMDSANITNIAVKNDDANMLWISMGGYNEHRVYESVNGDTNWINISSGLPQLPVYSIVQNKQVSASVHLYAGTELGVYLKKGTENWIPFNTNLPNVKIGEIEIYYAPKKVNSRLRAATYGRGLWETNLYTEDIPMSYVSSTITQKNLKSVVPGSSDVEIICFEIETEDVLNPLKVSQLSLSMDGTTDINDVSNIKIYFTGLDSAFSATNQFGSTTPAAADTISLIGTQTLLPGTNHFWVSYDLKSTAINGHVIDAKGLNVTVDSIQRIPTDTNPEGKRIIYFPYCIAGSFATDLEYISNVTVGSINQNSGRGSSGYEDYTFRIADFSKSAINNIKVNITDPVYSDELLVWIDWNIDDDFNDPGESAYSSGAIGNTKYTANVVPPDDAPFGITRMRIRLNNTLKSSNHTPCGLSGNGEVEDYSINVTPFNSVGSLSNHKKIVLYPNPVLNQLNVEIEGSSQTINFEILNSVGQTVCKSNFVDKTVIDMSHFLKGFYLIKFETGDGFLYRKFVKD